jgi:hypothetical protein
MLLLILLKRPSKAVNRMQRFALLLWTEIPAWQQEDNKYIESGYR